MSMRILAADVGTGTQDILLFESGKTIENNFKMVMPSPTVIVANRIKRATERGQPLLLTGVTMGGDPAIGLHATTLSLVLLSPLRLKQHVLLMMTSQWSNRWVL